MSASRSIALSAISILALGLAVAACGSSGATTQPAASGSVGPSVAPVVGVSSTAGSGGSDCTPGLIGRKAFRAAGFDAQHFCGPATATVTAAGATAAISPGWCETNAAGYTVSIGTQLFGSPSASQEPDALIILVDPSSGAGSISGVVAHNRFLLTSSPVAFGAGKLSGTFSGQGIVGGAISGSFTCGS